MSSYGRPATTTLSNRGRLGGLIRKPGAVGRPGRHPATRLRHPAPTAGPADHVA